MNQMGTKIQFFESLTLPLLNLQKGPFTVEMVKIGQIIGFGPIWPHFAHLGGPNGDQNQNFRKFDFAIVNNLQKGLFTVKMVKIGQ